MTTISPRRHLVQALTLVNDILARRRRDGMSLSEEENDLLDKIVHNAPRPAGAASGPSAFATATAEDRSNSSSQNKGKADLSSSGGSPGSTSTWRRGEMKELTAIGGDEDASSLINFAVSCSAVTSQPVSLVQLLVDHITKLVPARRPVSMMIFDGDYTVDPINGTLLANSARFISMFAEKSNHDIVFDRTAAAYFLPVSAEGELFGFVQISNMHAEGELSPERCKVLIAACAIGALALRTSWQLEDLEWSHRKQALLLKVAHSLTSDSFSRDSDLVQRLIHKSSDLADAQAAYFFRVDPDRKELRYFHEGDYFGTDAVFGEEGGGSGGDAAGNSAAIVNAPPSPPHHHGGSHSRGLLAHDDSDNDVSDRAPTSDAVKLAMRTAEHVTKHSNIVQLQQAAGDDDRYVDVAGQRAKHGGAGGASRSSNPNLSAAAVSGGVSISGAQRARTVDLTFSLVKTRSVHSLMGVPVLDQENQVKAVIVLTNKRHRRVARIDVPQSFAERDQEMMMALCGLASIALQNSYAANRLRQEKRQRDAILSVVGHLNEADIRNVDEICKYVMHGAKKLLNADRSTLFLIDEEHDELYSAVADSVGKVIRFPVGKGIAGRCALTGQAEVIKDAYKDDRFNQAVDKETGYRTVSILTVPVMSRGNTLAVAQLVNKLGSKINVPVPFSHEDQEVLKTFAMFAGIAIGNSKLLEFTVKAGQEAMALTAIDDNGGHQLRRTDTMTSMQLASTVVPIAQSEIAQVRDAMAALQKLKEANPAKFDWTSTTFDLWALREEAPDSAVARDYAAAVVVLLFQQTGFDRIYKIDEDTLICFVSQCRKMYRFVPYHNWFHAVDVTQTMYTFLYHGEDCVRHLLTELETFVMLVTAVVHDLDHMGTNNSYHLKTDSPLGILSAVSGNNSVLEVHHCNIAIQILGGPDCNIFSGLDKKDTSPAIRGLMQCVLATDMAKHGDLLNQYIQMRDDGFDKNNDAHRLLVMQVLIKLADVSNIIKPHHISRQWATAVTDEFYSQGDKERAKGLQVIPMLDRTLGTELAKGQLGFINFVGMKFFTEANALFKFKWAIDQLNSNKAKWEAILAEAEQNKSKTSSQD